MSRRIQRMTPTAPKRKVHSISVSRRTGWLVEDEAARTGRSMTAIVEEIILDRIAKIEGMS